MSIKLKGVASMVLKRAVPALFLTVLPSVVLAEGSLDSTTFLRVSQESQPGFQTKTVVPLTEYFGLDLDKLGDGHLSAHLYGWGRLDLADHNSALYSGDEDTIDGSLTYGYLQYRFDHANAQAKAGRFAVYEGILNERVDGAYLHTDLPYGFGVSAFGGAPVHTVSIPGHNTDGKGDGTFGGRAFYRKGGLLELGLSGVYESAAPASSAINALPGAFGNHRLVGGDIWLRPLDMVQVSGHSSYNTESGHFAEHSYLLQVIPVKNLVLAGTFDQHNDRDYFYSSILFADLIKNLNQESKVIGGSATYTFPVGVEATGDFKHYSRDIGHAERFGGELRGNFLQNTLRSGVSYHYLRASSDFAVVPVDWQSGSFHEARGYVMHDTKTYTASVDLLGYFFKKDVENRDKAWEATGSLGYHLTPALSLSGDMSYGQNPQFNDELKGLIRLTYNMNLGEGGKK